MRNLLLLIFRFLSISRTYHCQFGRTCFVLGNARLTFTSKERLFPQKERLSLNTLPELNRMSLALVTNLTTRWRNYSYKIVHQMAPLALVSKLTIRWRHLHWLQMWPPDGTTCISYKFSHQVEQLALVAKFSTRWRHLH